MTTAVYVVGGTPDEPGRTELKYSLRSLAANAPCIDEVWVVGDVPDWFAGVRMPLVPLADKMGNQRQSIERFVNYPAAPDTFVLLNDDMYIKQPIDGDLPTYRNKNPLSTWANAEGRLNNWHRCVIATAEWTAEQTGTDPHIYESHVPLTFDTTALRDVLAAYPDDRPFAVGEVYPIAGAGGEGTHAGNAKCKADDSFATKLALPMPYLSGNPDSWRGAARGLGAGTVARLMQVGAVKRRCADCPALIEVGTRDGRCASCRSDLERGRGTRQERGYDAAHDAERERWSPIVATGHVRCWRCREPISPDTPWDLGHDDHDRTRHRGPEHRGCNRATAGRCPSPLG